MRLFFWRKKTREPNVAEAAPPVTPREPLPASGAMPLASSATKPHHTREEIQNSILRFALDVLRAQGARVRVESSDILSTVTSDGAVTQYTASPAIARQHSGARLLVPGSAELDALMERCAANGAVASLALPARAEAHQVVAAGLRAPARDCRDCTTAAPDGGPPCEKCPVHDGAIVIAELRDPVKMRVLAIEPELSVEFGIRIGWSDRQGRSDEWQRVAVSSTHGGRLRPLSDDELELATWNSSPPRDPQALDSAYARAQDLLRPSLEAGAAFLRLRAESDYQRRLEDLRNTFDAHVREEPERASMLRDALRREMTRLAEAYSVRVTAELDSVCIITSRVARVAITTRHGTEVEVLADLGRAEVVPLLCSRCGTAVRFGVALPEGGIACSACAPHGRAAADVRDGDRGQGVLTMDQLERMTPLIWSQFVTWLLEEDRMRIQRTQWSGTLLVCHGSLDDQTVVAGALRPEAGWYLRAHDVQRFAALCVHLEPAVKVLVSPAPVSAEADTAASALGIRLLAGDVLAARLAAVADAHMHAQDRVRAETERRATRAAEIRCLCLEGVGAIEARLAQGGTMPHLRGRAAIAEAVNAVSDAYTTFQRASIAWETWLDDWAGVFGALPERDASLAILADMAQLDELRKRAQYLLLATDEAVKPLTGQALSGDLGFTAWRSAIAEALTARCEWLRWQLQVVDPARWPDFGAAHDDAAAARAVDVRSAAGHAEARVLKAYADLARRARLIEG